MNASDILPALPQGLKGLARAKALAGVLEAFDVDWALLGPQLAFQADRYGRLRLHLDAEFELLMLSWLPGQGTPIHDHGRSWGTARALIGELSEENYRWQGMGKPLAFRGENPLGGVLEVGPATVHRIVNKGGIPAVSLHLFSPPLAFFRTYDVSSGTRRQVEPKLSGASFELLAARDEG